MMSVFFQQFYFTSFDSLDLNYAINSMVYQGVFQKHLWALKSKSS